MERRHVKKELMERTNQLYAAADDAEKKGHLAIAQAKRLEAEQTRRELLRVS